MARKKKRKNKKKKEEVCNKGNITINGNVVLNSQICTVRGNKSTDRIPSCDSDYNKIEKCVNNQSIKIDLSGNLII